MLLFLALQRQFIGGVLGTHRKGRKAPEAGICPGQTDRRLRGLSRFTIPLGLPRLLGRGEEKKGMEGGWLAGTAPSWF